MAVSVATSITSVNMPNRNILLIFTASSLPEISSD